MKVYSYDTPSEEQAASCIILMLPGIGAFMAVLMFGFTISDDTIWSAFIQLIPWPQSAGGKVVSQILRFMVAYLPILVVSGGFVWLTNWIPLLHPIAANMRQDWSLLSFLLYGVALLPVIMQDEYRGLGSYQLASLAILTGGALVYLRPANPWFRLLALLGALGLSLGLLASGIYILYPQQAWSAHTTFPRWWETIYPLMQGVALAIIMVAPAILTVHSFSKLKLLRLHL